MADRPLTPAEVVAKRDEIVKQMRSARRLSLAPNKNGRDMAVVDAMNANTEATLLLIDQLRK